MKLFTGNRPFRGNRGWCLVEERPFVYGAPVNDGSLTFQVRIAVLGASKVACRMTVQALVGSGRAKLLPLSVKHITAACALTYNHQMSSCCLSLASGPRCLGQP